MGEPGTRKRVQEVFTVLSNVLPTPVEARLSWVSLDGFGETVFDDKGDKRRAVIRLRKDLSKELAVETLVHEYAHLLACDYYGTSHDAVWGIAYSDAYRVIYGEH